MEYLGVELDLEKNNDSNGKSDLSTENSKVRVLRIPTNEELVIALDTEKIVSEQLG